MVLPVCKCNQLIDQKKNWKCAILLDFFCVQYLDVELLATPEAEGLYCFSMTMTNIVNGQLVKKMEGKECMVD